MSETKIQATKVPEGARLGFLHDMLPGAVALPFEQRAYTFLSEFARDYTGGYWDFYRLDNGGFYMAPLFPARMQVRVHTNGYEGQLSNDAAGIMACLFSLNQLSWTLKTDDSIRLAVERYYQLHDYASEHPEAPQILRAIN